MNYYHKQENVNEYRAMMENFDNHLVLDMLRESLPAGASVLELGMGTGADLLELAKDYRVTGSDFSPAFLTAFRKEHPEIEALEIDASDFSLDRKFDCIYSNKVLYHLSAAQLQTSLQIQSQHLHEKGIVFMTMWYGEYREELYEDDLMFTYYTEQDLVKQIPHSLMVEKIERYTEMEKDDSIVFILRKI